jgi:hypothetical protein
MEVKMAGRRVLCPGLSLVATIVLAVATGMGGPTPVGSLVGSTNATLNGHTPLPHTAVLSGDSLQVSNGLAVVALDQGNRMVMGRDTKAAFSREGNTVMVALARGTISLYHPKATRSFRVKVGEAVVSPFQAPQTLGEIAMTNGLLLVTVKEGTLLVEKAGNYQKVIKGKTITIETAATGSAEPTPQPSRSAKHILGFGSKALYMGIIPGVGGTAWTVSKAASTGKPASPVTPGTCPN